MTTVVEEPQLFPGGRLNCSCYTRVGQVEAHQHRSAPGWPPIRRATPRYRHSHGSRGTNLLPQGNRRSLRKGQHLISPPVHRSRAVRRTEGYALNAGAVGATVPTRIRPATSESCPLPGCGAGEPKSVRREFGRGLRSPGSPSGAGHRRECRRDRSVHRAGPPR